MPRIVAQVYYVILVASFVLFYLIYLRLWKNMPRIVAQVYYVILVASCVLFYLMYKIAFDTEQFLSPHKWHFESFN